jgi:hypothetical protein
MAVFLFSSAAQPGYAAPQSEITPSAAVRQNCAIKGSVNDAVTNRGLRKAYLILGGLYASVTDDHGNFVFEDVKPGSYVLNAEHQGYIDGYFGEAGSEPVEIKLAPGQTLLDIKIELTPQAVITGRLVNEDGDPWTHASVNMFRSKWSHGHRTIQSFSGEEVNDQGEFRIGQVPPGKYYLAAEPDSGWEMRNRPSGKDVTTRQPTWYSNSLDLEGATPIIVAPGNQISGLEIRLRRGNTHRIRGKLLGLDTVPPPDEKTGRFGARRISAQAASAAGVISKGGTIRSDGSFEIAGVPPGTYELRVEQGSWFTNNNVNLASVKIQVEDQDLEDVSIELIAPRPVKGAIEISEKGSIKLSGHIVQLESDTPGWSPEAISRADGSFDFALVGPGRYRIQVLGSGFYLKEIRYGDVVSTDGTISVTGAEGRLVLLLSTLGARLSGKAIPTTGGKTSRAKAQVVLISNRAPARLGTFDQTGTFTFQDLAPGKYRLYAFEGVPGGAWEDPDFMKEVGDAGIEIQLTDGEVKSADVPLIPMSDLAPILKKLGME